LLIDVKDMTNGINAADGIKGGRKLYSMNVQAKVQSSTSCSFCWFVLTLHPSLKGMPERDEDTFRAHLVKAHRLQGEIQA
jgi:hypothetical protein